VGRPWVLAVCGSLGLLGGCVVTRQGTLTRLPDGAAVPVTVQVEADSAIVSGTDPATGERLEGHFRVDRSERTERGVLAPPAPVGGGTMSPGQPPSPASGRPATLRLSGRLDGDKGTSLTCVFEVEKRLRLRGSGLCRTLGAEEPSGTYRLRF
jgi:hypothetical protein